MVQAAARPMPTVSATFELFGTARLTVGRKVVHADVPARADSRHLAEALGAACPELVGPIVRSDGRGLVESYTMNLNGRRFLGSDIVEVGSDDRLLVFSSQAGG